MSTTGPKSCIALLPLPDRQDQAFALALSAFAPSGIRGVVLAGFFAAVMSTVSALSNSVATIFSLDVYRRLFRRPVTDRELLTAGRLASGAALLFACLTTSVVAMSGFSSTFKWVLPTWPRPSSP